jgi:hypothetical protein
MTESEDILRTYPDDWKGRFVQRSTDGAIVASFARPQPGLAEEGLPIDDPELVEFENPPMVSPRNVVAELDALKRDMETLKGKL